VSHRVSRRLSRQLSRRLSRYLSRITGPAAHRPRVQWRHVDRQGPGRSRRQL